MLRIKNIINKLTNLLQLTIILQLIIAVTLTLITINIVNVKEITSTEFKFESSNYYANTPDNTLTRLIGFTKNNFCI